MGRLRRLTLGGAMACIAVLTLVLALIVRIRRASEAGPGSDRPNTEGEREARYQAEIASLRAELAAERLQFIEQNHANIYTYLNVIRRWKD